MVAHNVFILYTKKYPHDFILPTRVLSSYKMFRFDLPKHVMKRVCWFVSHCVFKTKHVSSTRAFSCIDFYSRVLKWFSKALIFPLI